MKERDLEDLRSTVRLTGSVRWIGVAFGLLMAFAFVPISRPAALAVTVLMALYNAASWPLLGYVRGRRLLVLAGILLGLDFLAVTAFVYLLANDRYSTSYVVYALVGIEASVLFLLAGTAVFAAAFVVAFLLLQLIRLHYLGFPLEWNSIAFRMGVVLLLVLFAGLIVRQSDRRRQRAEADARRRRMIFKTSVSAIIEASSDGLVTDWNDCAERIFGWTRDEIVGRSLAETIVPPPYREAHTRGMRHFAKTGEGPVLGETLDIFGLRKDGSEFPIELSISPMSEERGSSLIAFARDITERKRAEDLENLRVRVTEILADARGTEAMAPQVIEAVCESFGWTAGELWALDTEGQVLRRAAHWQAPSPAMEDFVRARADFATEPGHGLVGRVWQDRCVIALPDIDDLAAFLSAREATAAGIHSAIAFPLGTGGSTTAVVVFYSPSFTTYDDDLITMLTSITTQVHQFLEREESDQRIRAILENVGDGIVTIDSSGQIKSFNRAARRLLGYEPTEVVGKKIDTMVEQGRQREFVEYLSNRLRPGKAELTSGVHETVGCRKDGSTFPMEFIATDMRLGGRRLFIATLRDISERKAHTEALQYQALHDALTTLPNRTLFHDRVSQELLAAQRHRRRCGLILLDMDRFKEVNDTLGHDAGDQLLEMFAVRVREAVRDVDTVARLGGDEFAVLVSDISDISGIVLTAQRITNALEAPFLLGQTTIRAHASMGITAYPEHGDDVGTLMRRADVAMYVAKQSHSGHAIYAAQQEERMKRRIELLDQLRDGIAANQLVLHYHPKIDIRTGRAIGVEALVRWQHEKYGLVPPDDFISAAEESDLIQPLTRWVLNEALHQLHDWDGEGLHLSISVNLSARNLLEDDLAMALKKLLEEWQIEPDRLTLEITETTAVSATVDGNLANLRALGCGLSLDDFGTGFASLAYLRRLPLTQLKLDRSFVTVMATSSDDAAVIQPSISLAHNLGLLVVAEGIEDQDSFDMLAGFECDFAQGFLMARPMPAEELPTWMWASPWGIARS
ncbi:MAG: EAL domain-containing protein [Candidatus Dormibacteria bacterium]